MKCPYCGESKDRVVDSRESREGKVIRRRRECLSCGRRVTTYEQIEQLPIMVVKKDGRRERFDRGKLMAGIMRACEKRPVPMQRLEEICDEAEGLIQDKSDREIASDEIGELVMERLRELDEVAYVRFASVYRQFKDINAFMAELKNL
ncbi:MAG: transcriptional regulator NrdR, partial [Acidobacteriota bacterium]